MKTFYIEVPVLEATGTQCFSVEASSEAEALKTFARSGGELVDEEMEPIKTGAPYISSSEEKAADELEVWT